MKYIGTTKLEHGVVMHYENSCHILLKTIHKINLEIFYEYSLL
jgi:hypothetical protein